MPLSNLLLKIFLYNHETYYVCQRPGCWAHVKVDDLPAHGHESGGKEIIIQPTCTEGGRYYYNCINCGEEITISTTGPTGHKWDHTGFLQDGCISTNYYECSVCHETKTEQSGEHNWVSIGQNHEKCTICGQERGQV